MLISVIFLLLALFNVFGIQLKVSASISRFNLFSGFVGLCLITVALYKSFLALNDLKNGRYNEKSWEKHFKSSGILFCISSALFLADIYSFTNNNENINAFFVFRDPNFYIDLNYSSVMLLGIGVLLIFISRLRPDFSKGMPDQ